MLRADKQEQIDFLKGIFSDVESVVLTSVQGLDAAQVSTLRRNLHDEGVGFKVIKNKLAKIAARETPVSVLGDDFVDSTAMAWSMTDAVAPAKILVKFQIKVGYNSGKRVDLKGLKALATLPSLDELRAQLLGVVQSVPAKLLAQMNAPASHIVGVLQAKIDKEKETV
jgi:large subunit ribosomal protein L10